MKTLYFYCSSGISGNMVLGALIELIDELKKVSVDRYNGIDMIKEFNGYAIKIQLMN